MSVLIETTLGDLVIDLNVDLCPKTCENFLKLCKLKFYNNCEFYKIEKDFIARTGRSKQYGNSSFYQLLNNQRKDNISLELETTPKLKHKRIGVLGMVNHISKNSLGSEFYFTLKDELSHLDGNHVIFAQVEEGIPVLSKLNQVITDENSIPLQKVMILHTYILDDPFEDSPQLLKIIPPNSPPEETDSLAQIYDQDEIKTLNSISEREAKSRAITLEILGDIPDADMKPPENVLFVCKLNPVTQDDDLELIFSRFGEVKSCNIIRDYKTGDSLQYAFIEFETKQQCEMAFLKMQNAVIDDRRIHVDFSQSVSNYWKDFVYRKRPSKQDQKITQYRKRTRINF
ncbi:Cyclophilin type peptidyl-prolyl cis-trans isomerase/CLD family protein [Cryptosporidium meleagridis]|uniref:Peptidyl-prolyl cis-trans isomerase n=1 Tax=Cryptosporidium meleagridis TaxID=93969 RepID=A0A2P4Z4D8_9CRYT|nr:Cyclophilin type peptidyl-prolyl cis-trans isomerase/CLD family protein [Cryptosporidium meleagridis]